MVAIHIIDNHLELADIGTNTHAQIDTHIAAADDYVKRDGSLPLTADWDIGTSKLKAYKLQARDASGIRMDGLSGLGVFVKDNGDVGLGDLTPTSKLDVNGSIQAKAANYWYAMNLFADFAGRGFLINTPDYSYNVSGSRLRMSLGAGSGDTYVIFQSEWKGTTGRDIIFNPSGGNIGIGITTPTALLDVNSDIFRLRTAKTPATAGAAGNQGDICWDADFIYVCTATNSWERAAIAPW